MLDLFLICLTQVCFISMSNCLFLCFRLCVCKVIMEDNIMLYFLIKSFNMSTNYKSELWHLPYNNVRSGSLSNMCKNMVHAMPHIYKNN